jgi:hypothetical protein
VPSIDLFPTPDPGGRFDDVLTVFGAVFVVLTVVVRLYDRRRRRKKTEARVVIRKPGH